MLITNRRKFAKPILVLAALVFVASIISLFPEKAEANQNYYCYSATYISIYEDSNGGWHWYAAAPMPASHLGHSIDQYQVYGPFGAGKWDHSKDFNQFRIYFSYGAYMRVNFINPRWFTVCYTP